MNTIEIQLPEEPLISLKETPASFATEIKKLAAIKLFELGRLSSGRAAHTRECLGLLFLWNWEITKFAHFQLLPLN